MTDRMKPVIRFSEFNEDWEQRKLGEISQKITLKNKENKFTETLTNSAEFGIISQNDYFDKEISNKSNLDGYYIVENNDFVYNPRISNFAPVGPIKRNKLNRTGVMSPLYYVFKTENIDHDYLEKYFDTSYWHIFMKMNGDSGARADRFAIKDSILKEMPIPFPVQEEQTKIGNFFKELDETITLQERELDLLKEQKNGFLQKLFPKNNEKVPEFRFAGFTDTWKKCKLSDVVSLFGGNAFKSTDSKVEGTKWLKIANVGIGKLDWTASSYLPTNYWNQYKNYQLFKDDYVMALTRPILNGNLKISKIDTECLLNQRVAKLIFTINREFGYQLLKKRDTVSMLENELAGTDPPNLGSKNLEKINVAISNSLVEQQKIGNFFKQLDKTINLQEQELNQLKEMKKAFLQKMFA